MGECMEVAKEWEGGKEGGEGGEGWTREDMGGVVKGWMGDLLVASQNLKFHFGTEWQKRKREERMKREGEKGEGEEGEGESEEYRAFLEPFLCKALLLLRLKPLLRPSLPSSLPSLTNSLTSPSITALGSFNSSLGEGGAGEGGAGGREFSMAVISKEVLGFLKNEAVDILSLVNVVKRRSEEVLSKV